MKGGTEQAGDVADGMSIEIRVKHIIGKLKELPSDERFSHLVHLSLIGHYCSAAYFEAVRFTHQLLGDTFESESLQSRVIHTLIRSREGLFQEFITDLNRISARIGRDLSDNHHYNEMVNTIGESFHLGQLGEDAKFDTISTFDFLTKIFFQAVYYFQSRPYIDRYDVLFIVDRMQVAIRDNEIPHDLIFSWFEDRFVEELFLKDKLANEEEGSYRARIKAEAAELVQRDVYDALSGEVRSIYVRYFLLKMGILKIESLSSISAARF